MSDRRDEDDEALGWAGDDDPTLTPVRSSPVEAAAPAATTAPVQAAPGAGAPTRRTVLDEAEDAEDRAAEQELADAEKASAQLSSAALIGMGVLGGVYLLFTIGWVVYFTRFETVALGTFDTITGLVSHTLAVAASPLWFVTTLLLTQKRGTRYTFLWLVIGVLVLVPWPFLLGGK